MKLMPEQDWIAQIETLKSQIGGNLKESLLNAIKTRIPNQKFGIMFSGGVDSSLIALICKQFGADFICYAVGIENSTDLVAAKKAAKLLDIKLVTKQYTLKQAEKIIQKVTKIVGTDIVKVGVGAVVYACGELAKKDKINILFSGLGSEEIFAGYERHKVKDVNQECWNGLNAMWQRDLTRDYAIANKLNFEIETPFLDHELIKAAMNIPGNEKISNEYKKIPLRKLAVTLKLPIEIAWRKKQAAQYGSKFDRAILRLARKHGFKYKKDYLNNQLKLGTLYSSGKDSTYALYLMQQQHYNLKCLITIKSKNKDSYMFHTPNIDLTELQSQALNLPLIQITTKGEKETELKDLKKVIKQAKTKYKLDGIITGALYSNYQKERIENICNELNLKCYSPLWHIDQEQELKEIVQAGFKVILSSIAADGLNTEFLGKVIDNEFIDKLTQIKGINIAGEGGEFESLVLDAPNFTKKLDIIDAKIVMENECTGIYQIEKVNLIKK